MRRLWSTSPLVAPAMPVGRLFGWMALATRTVGIEGRGLSLGLGRGDGDGDGAAGLGVGAGDGDGLGVTTGDTAPVVAGVEGGAADRWAAGAALQPTVTSTS